MIDENFRKISREFFFWSWPVTFWTFVRNAKKYRVLFHSIYLCWKFFPEEIFKKFLLKEKIFRGSMKKKFIWHQNSEIFSLLKFLEKKKLDFLEKSYWLWLGWKLHEQIFSLDDSFLWTGDDEMKNIELNSRRTYIKKKNQSIDKDSFRFETKKF